jgi:signal transduction histidine kinase
VTGAKRSLPPEVDQAAYRIVQEALTNVSRHAGQASAWVHLCYTPDALEIQVDDDGAGISIARSTSNATSSSTSNSTSNATSNGTSNRTINAASNGQSTSNGLGLIGMRERVTALGGRLHAGPRDGGGFQVRAEIPAETPAT